ncbi:MAG TPA: SBBP repeat-containing protein [bacterium]|nr:SBBP repeat-containing protein [bacterium]
MRSFLYLFFLSFLLAACDSPQTEPYPDAGLNDETAATADDFIEPAGDEGEAAEDMITDDVLSDSDEVSEDDTLLEEEDTLFSDEDGVFVDEEPLWPKQWARGSRGLGIAADGSGNIYVTGVTYVVIGRGPSEPVLPDYCSEEHGCYEDIFLTKSDLFGNHLWTKQWGTQWSDWGQSVAVDDSGNVYVTGSTRGDILLHDDDDCPGPGITCPEDVFLTKLDGNGKELWTLQWGTADDDDGGTSVKVAASGSVYVTGFTTGVDFDGEMHIGDGRCTETMEEFTAPCSDMFLTKVSVTGMIEWSIQYGTMDDEHGESLALDSSENSYVTGATAGSFDGDGTAETRPGDIFLVKFDRTGAREWLRQWGTEVWDGGHAVVTDGEGSVFITGLTRGALDGNSAAEELCSVLGEGDQACSDTFLTKFNAAGEKQWTRQWGSIDYDAGYGVVIDSSGGIFVTGSAAGDVDDAVFAGGSGTDIMLTKFDAAGERLWTKLWGGTADDSGMDVVVDLNDTVYLTGWVTHYDLRHPELSTSGLFPFLIRELPEINPAP